MAAVGPEGQPFVRMFEDSYNGVLIDLDPSELQMSVQQFYTKLQIHLRLFRKDDRRGVWLKVPIQGSQFVHAVVQCGFVFHHAKPDYVMLTCWLPQDVPNTLPAYPHTQVGVAGFVLNNKNQVLAIQERVTRLPNFWKLPGGLVDAGEQLRHAVVREVLEETGIKTQFVSLAAFRESFLPDKTDYYCICCMQLDMEVYGSEQAPSPVPQEAEIAKAAWLPLDEFLSGPFYDISGILGAHMKTAADVCISEMSKRRNGQVNGSGIYNSGLKYTERQWTSGRGGPMVGLYYIETGAPSSSKL